MEHTTKEQYVAEIENWDWDVIKADAIANSKDPDIAETDDDGNINGTTFLGTVFDLAPSGKFYMPWTSNQTEEDCDEDEKFYAALDEVAEKHGMYIENGEGDPCDLFASITIEEDESEDDGTKYSTPA